MLPLPIILNRPLRVLFYFAQYAKLFCAGLCCEVPGEGQTLHITHAPVPGAPAPKDPQVKKDEFFWLNAVNRATVVTGLRNGQFGEDLARPGGRRHCRGRGPRRSRSLASRQKLHRLGADVHRSRRSGRDRHSCRPFEPGHPLDAAHGHSARRCAQIRRRTRGRDRRPPCARRPSPRHDRAELHERRRRPAHLLRPLSARHRRLAPARARAPLRIPRPLQPVRHGRHRSQRHGLAA